MSLRGLLSLEGVVGGVNLWERGVREGEVRGREGGRGNCTRDIMS